MNIIKNELLSKHTTYKIGGTADLFSEAQTTEQVVRAVAYARKESIPYIIIGGGSNLLFSDLGIRGMAIKIAARKITFDGNFIHAEAGIYLKDLLQEGALNGCGGMEFLAGIPGTLGGAIYGNAGAYGRGIDSILKAVTIFDGKEIKTIRAEELLFDYRSSIFKKNDYVILSAVIISDKKDRGLIENEINTIIAERRAKHPDERFGSCGCFFKNIQEEGKERKTAAGKLLEDAGVKGLKKNNAFIYEKHCNFILNSGGASSEDILSIAREARERVFLQTGLNLENEVQIIPVTPPFKSLKI